MILHIYTFGYGDWGYGISLRDLRRVFELPKKQLNKSSQRKSTKKENFGVLSERIVLLTRILVKTISRADSSFEKNIGKRLEKSESGVNRTKFEA